MSNYCYKTLFPIIYALACNSGALEACKNFLPGLIFAGEAINHKRVEQQSIVTGSSVITRKYQTW